MKNTLLTQLGFILLSTPLAATAQQFGDFTYTSDGTAITITGYTGPDGPVRIPASINDLPVTTIGFKAFYDNFSIASVTIPDSVTSIEFEAFELCFNLASLTIPDSVTNIGYAAFNVCIGLTNVTVLNGVTSIGIGAFNDCVSLAGVFFQGNAPSFGAGVFDNTHATVYYLPGTAGWSATFDFPTRRLWNPLMQSSGIGPAGFGFNITGTADIPIVIEVTTSLANAAWVPLQSLNLTNGAFYFSDPNWTNYPARFYRIRSP